MKKCLAAIIALLAINVSFASAQPVQYHTELEGHTLLHVPSEFKELFGSTMYLENEKRYFPRKCWIGGMANSYGFIKIDCDPDVQVFVYLPPRIDIIVGIRITDAEGNFKTGYLDRGFISEGAMNGTFREIHSMDDLRLFSEHGLKLYIENRYRSKR